jgi:23S rRNA U2552 (ribose-2'-O)-methylase RlmE/FtsJ
MMQNIGRELHRATGAFNVTRLDESPPHILDMCMAPGGFLFAALQRNPDAVATAYTLPFGGSTNGHWVFLPDHSNVKKMYLDITMLAADMGVEGIPQDHPESIKFLAKHFETDRIYDIAICDGHVQRKHDLAAYREHREARRLITTQLALSLEHLKPFGTMIVLINKVETEQPGILEIVHQFHKFSSVQLFKPTKGHADRSSFYMVATDIQTDHAEAAKAVEEWKRTWKIATFGSEDEFSDHIRRSSVWANKILENFGPVLIEKSRAVWETQIRGLKEAPYMKCAQSRPQRAG